MTRNVHDDEHTHTQTRLPELLKCLFFSELVRRNTYLYMQQYSF